MSATESTAYLEHFPEPGQAAHRILLDQLPYRIGRCTTANYIIYSPQVSKDHTEIYRKENEYRARDLGSTNGTFINGQRVTDGPLVGGDILHVAEKEFRFVLECDSLRTEANENYTQLWNPQQRPASMILSREHLCEMLQEQWVRVVFQPIVNLQTGEIFGYEALGRGTHSSLSMMPKELFSLAAQCNLAGELSRVIREIAAQEATSLSPTLRIFFNLHASEMTRELLQDNLRHLQATLTEHEQLVLEVHEAAVSDLPTIRWLRDQLGTRIGLAYDDFGAGQSRLTELAEVPPDFVKLDIGLVQDIDMAPARQTLVRSLYRYMLDLGVQVVAEGIERAEEAQFFRELGCPLAQGYYFGRPRSMALIIDDGQLAAAAAVSVPVSADASLSAGEFSDQSSNEIGH